MVHTGFLWSRWAAQRFAAADQHSAPPMTMATTPQPSRHVHRLLFSHRQFDRPQFGLVHVVV